MRAVAIATRLWRCVARAWRALLACLVFGAPAYASALDVVDDAGQRVHLAGAAQRVIVLSPAATETLFAIGAGMQVVGTSAYSNWPEAAKRVPRIGDAFGLDREAVIAAHPDLAIVWGSGVPAQRVAQLRDLGIPVYTTEPRRIDDVASTVERFGVLTGHEADARGVALAYRARIAQLRTRYGDRAPVSAFLQIAQAPLMTVNGEHVLSEALAVCGARNVFAGLPKLAPPIAREAVIAADPQIIVALGGEGEGDAFAAWRPLGAMRAVRMHAFVSAGSDAIARPSPAFADALATLCERIDAVRAPAH